MELLWTLALGLANMLLGALVVGILEAKEVVDPVPRPKSPSGIVATLA